VLILARYIPRPTGERLAEAGINFVDAEGNMHLGLGKKYQSLILGKVRKSRSSEGRSLGPAAVQLLFTLAAMPDSVNWTVRRLASVAGVGKTATAQARQRWVAEGILHRSSDGECRVVNSAALHDQCLVGYSRVLRPRLLLGRYRSKEKDPGEFLARFKSAAKETGTRWALTGGPATYALQRFYRGEETPVFVNELAPDIVRRLKLLPDQKGPIILLRAFGEVVNWRTANDMPIAQPWLIYAELMYQDDPRAHEAAEQLRREYLKQ
jgi:hypothetical protein